MKYTTEVKTIEDDLIEHNKISVEDLFEMYRAQKFIYPQKMERLKPVFNIVKDTWTKAMKLNFPLFWVSSVDSRKTRIAATSTSWQYVNTGMLAQHLTSNHPVGSRIIFLGMLEKVIENQRKGFLESYQIYYRPQNKYPARLFDSLSQRAGKKLSEIICYNYHEVPLLKRYSSTDIELIEIENNSNSDFIKFVNSQRGEVFIKAQELNSEDIALEKLNSKFEVHGLKRRRRIFAAIAPQDKRIYGAIIINQSSLGLNFSFFENSSELILCKHAGAIELSNVAAALLQRAFEAVGDLPLAYVPVLVDPIHSSIVEKFSGPAKKSYNLFIMLRGGYEIWYEHVDELTNSVFQRFIENSYEHTTV